MINHGAHKKKWIDYHGGPNTSAALASKTVAPQLG